MAVSIKFDKSKLTAMATKKIEIARSRRLSPGSTSIVIDELGGTSCVASICSRTPQTVSEWRRYGMPSAWVYFLREKYRNHPVMKSVEVRNF